MDVLYCRLDDEKVGCGKFFDLKHIKVMYEGEERLRAGCFPKTRGLVGDENQDL
jgi:hypothetical protein